MLVLLGKDALKISVPFPMEKKLHTYTYLEITKPGSIKLSVLTELLKNKSRCWHFLVLWALEHKINGTDTEDSIQVSKYLDFSVLSPRTVTKQVTLKSIEIPFGGICDFLVPYAEYF